MSAMLNIRSEQIGLDWFEFDDAAPARGYAVSYVTCSTEMQCVWCLWLLRNTFMVWRRHQHPSPDNRLCTAGVLLFALLQFTDAMHWFDCILQIHSKNIFIHVFEIALFQSSKVVGNYHICLHFNHWECDAREM